MLIILVVLLVVAAAAAAAAAVVVVVVAVVVAAVVVVVPESPSTQYLSSLVRNTIKSMVFGTRSLKYWVLGTSGSSSGSGSSNTPVPLGFCPRMHVRVCIS